MAAFFNFAALFVVGTAVANTVAKTVNVDALGTTPAASQRAWPWPSAHCIGGDLLELPDVVGRHAVLVVAMR